MRRAGLLAAGVVVLFGGPAQSREALAREGPAAVPSHPREVALVKEGAKGSVYRKFPSGLRLYVSDRDPPGRSVCVNGCASAWPPVFAPQDAQPVGDWTVVKRPDGRPQWAYRGKPVYTRFHDAPDEPTGEGLYGVWRMLRHTPSPPE